MHVEENNKNSKTNNYKQMIIKKKLTGLQDMTRESINEPFYWNEKPGTLFVNELNNAYEKIVYWRKNLFLPPTRATGKCFVNEMTGLINA